MNKKTGTPPETPIPPDAIIPTTILAMILFGNAKQNPCTPYKVSLWNSIAKRTGQVL